MGDYTVYITVTYAVSGAALLWLAVASFRKMKSTEREAASLRRNRKGQS